LLLPISVFVIFGAVSTYIHLTNQTLSLSNALNLNLMLMSFLILTGLLIRFFKWHFFLRIYEIRIRIRRSFYIFFISLFVNLFFPLLIGETLMKNYLLRKENYAYSFRNVTVILLERLLDIVAILLFGIIFLAFSSDKALINSPQLYLYIGITVAVIATTAAFLTKKVYFSFKFLMSLLIGCAGWFIIYLIYFALPAATSGSSYISFFDFGYIFSNNLVFYPTTPMGLFVSGNYLYIALEEYIKQPQLLVQTVINIRIASILPTALVGLIMAVNGFRKRKTTKEFHFDEISDDYAEMIPEHVRERLVTSKCDMIIDDLKQGYSSLAGLTGLDLGGGKGWHTSRLLDMMHVGNVVLVEKSRRQTEDAEKRDPRIKPVIADIAELPFEENYADFAFSINVFHHLDNREAQRKAFESLSKVLKPGGKFYLHEISVQNLFIRLYLNYFFPLVKTIDEGIENWIDPQITSIGNFISAKISYFTFLPEFAGKTMTRLFEPIERKLENSRLGKYSAHYLRVFENNK
jgi:SAM-dependent methyltransferase/uncharacterized membrane protein YbhN (UPF0104 family)